MKALLSLFFRPKFLITIAFFGVLVVAFQNCQQGGAAFGTLRSTCVTDCDPVDEPNDELIKVQILDGDDGRLDLLRTDTSLTVFGSCSRGGYPTATITAVLRRSSAPNPTKTLTTTCSGGGWQVTFNGIQDYTPTINSADLDLKASIVAQDDEGENVYPAISSNGLHTVAVAFAAVGVNPSPSPSPAGNAQTISIYSAGRRSPDLKKLTIDAYLYYPSPVPSTLAIDFTNTLTGFTGTKGPFAFPAFYLPSVISVDIRPGMDDTSIASTADATAQKYRITLRAPGTSLRDEGFVYEPLPAGVTQRQVDKNGSSYCHFTADAYGNAAKSVRIPLVFALAGGDPQSFTLNYEYRNLQTGSAWRSRSQAISLNAANVGEIKLNSDTTEPNPHNQLLLFRIYYKQTVYSIVTNGHLLSSNGNCN